MLTGTLLTQQHPGTLLWLALHSMIIFNLMSLLAEHSMPLTSDMLQKDMQRLFIFF